MTRQTGVKIIGLIGSGHIGGTVARLAIADRKSTRLNSSHQI